MRHIDRVPKPDILVKNEARWQTEYEVKRRVDASARPTPARYRHKDILDTLKAMSHTKCFYCERSLKGEPNEIDHHIEVAIDGKGAYLWDNLVLACENCNNKIKHSIIPVTEALDPCGDSDAVIREHLTFVSEQIVPRNDSIKGKKTIEKYRLDTERLDYRRMRRLNELSRVIIRLQKTLIEEKRQHLTDCERDEVMSYASEFSEFSYMCQLYIERVLGKML